MSSTFGRAGLVALAILGGALHAQPWPQISLAAPIRGFTFPVHATHAGDGSGRMFVAELAGRVRIVRDGKVLAAPFLDIRDRVGCSQGLLSIAFPPDFAKRRHFYVNYTEKDTCKVVIARYDVTDNPDIANARSEQRVLVVAHENEGSAIFHSGGELAFGPDGLLYVGIGDNDAGADPGDKFGFAQDLGSLRGKILRLDVETGNPATYVVPPSNPFVKFTGARKEIWAIGVRNPWRSSFDRETGDYYVADVGQNAYEEINFEPAGSAGGLNFGWPIMEGPQCHTPATNCDQTDLTLPVAGYPNKRGAGDCSITGGKVYRGAAFPRLKGIYIYGDYCSGRIYGLRRVDGAWKSTMLRNPATDKPAINNEGLVGFGEDEAGNLYVTDSGAGLLYPIVEATAGR